MDRSAGTVSSIKALRYPGSSCLARCTCDELPCPLLTWLSTELTTLCPELRDSSRTGDVLLGGELRTLLSNMLSPLTVLTSEVLGPSILNKVTEFLVSELQAAQIMKRKELHPEEKTTGDESEKEQRVKDDSRELTEFCQEDEDDDDKDRRKMETQAEWILLLHALDMDASLQFTDVSSEVDSRLARLPCGAMTNPLLNTSLSSEQWAQVKKINQVLSEDYRCRRQMMIKRFQVTLESFAWGEKQKERSEALASMPPLSSLSGSSRVSSSLLIAAREDKFLIEPIKAGTSTPVYKILMGSVPDRGGRPGEIEPPMPAWTDRRAKGNKSGRGGGQHPRQRFSDKKKKGKHE
ncbi:protein FAM98B [Anarrhichthys ocellatus]|uniref:protein FAM98B n=1 Tax=Anarrhichthys ocellatus TaxID=433405 RepID=UPI0012EEAE94|nr:protein FAM98B-like [Anarrhichthys ocellatus]